MENTYDNFKSRCPPTYATTRRHYDDMIRKMKKLIKKKLIKKKLREKIEEIIGHTFASQ